MQNKTDTTEIREQHRFDIPSLEKYMKDNLEGFSGGLTVQQFVHGQSNPTFILGDDRNTYVLRKKPPGKLLPSAHAVDREFRIISVLGKKGVPVPRAYLLCMDDSVIGTPFYLMEYVEGRIFRSPFAPEASGNEERKAIYDSMNETLAKIHRVDWAEAGLSDYGKPGNYMERQVDRWTKQYMASQTGKIESMERLIAWLRENIPSHEATSIVHGDYRLENMIIHPHEPRVIAVLDWEISTLGHPLADLAYNCMPYHIPDFNDIKMSLQGRDLSLLGIPSEKDYLGSYCRRAGIESIPSWEFFLAFSIFRLASIVQGVYKRGLDGNASSQNARFYGEYARFLADTGWGLAQKGTEA